MLRQRVRLTVEIDLDPVPGAYHTPEDVQRRISSMLTYAVAWYHPTVSQAMLLPLQSADYQQLCRCQHCLHVSQDLDLAQNHHGYHVLGGECELTMEECSNKVRNDG